MNRNLCLVAILALVGGASAREPKIHLALDYSRPRQWAFTVDYKAERIIAEAGSETRASATVACLMSARPVKVYQAQRLAFVIDSVAVESNLYDLEQETRIEDSLSGSEFSLGIINGCPVFDTLRTFAVDEISRWDFVLQFAKLLPDMPVQPVSRGYSWESSGVFPVRTPVGEVPCDIYRLYTIESVAKDTSRVSISWQFRYAAAEKAVQGSKILKKVPISGKGTGTAVMDPKSKALIEAKMRFETPPATYESKTVQWVEVTTLKALDIKKKEEAAQ